MRSVINAQECCKAIAKIRSQSNQIKKHNIVHIHRIFSFDSAKSDINLFYCPQILTRIYSANLIVY